jgi:TonB family protein
LKELKACKKIAKKLSFTITMLMLNFSISYGQEESPIEKLVDKKRDRVLNTATNDSIDVYTAVTHMPEFPGGDLKLLSFIAKNYAYPKLAKEKELQGTSYIQFVIDTDGVIQNVKILKGIQDCSECDNEALRVVSKLPNWKPGKTKEGKLVNVYFVVPVKVILR